MTEQQIDNLLDEIGTLSRPWFVPGDIVHLRINKGKSSDPPLVRAQCKELFDMGYLLMNSKKGYCLPERKWENKVKTTTKTTIDTDSKMSEETTIEEDVELMDRLFGL